MRRLGVKPPNAGLLCLSRHPFVRAMVLAEVRFTSLQTAEIIKTAAAKPADRMGFIEACVNQHAGLPQDPTLAAFQMRVEGRMVTVDGRHLPPPELMYDRPVRQAKPCSSILLLKGDYRARAAGLIRKRPPGKDD